MLCVLTATLSPVMSLILAMFVLRVAAQPREGSTTALDLFSRAPPPVLTVEVPEYTVVNVTSERPLKTARMMQGLRIRMQEANDFFEKGDLSKLKSSLRDAATLIG